MVLAALDAVAPNASIALTTALAVAVKALRAVYAARIVEVRITDLLASSGLDEEVAISALYGTPDQYVGKTVKVGDVLLGFARTTDQPWSHEDRDSVNSAET